MKLQLLLFLIIPITAGLPLNCLYETTDWVSIGSLYQCKVENLFVDSQSTTVDAVNGTHSSGKSNADVKVIYIYLSPNLLFMPKEISQSDLEPFQNLNALYLLNNRIKIFDPAMFDPKLKHMLLQNDQLESISANVLDPFEDS